MNWKWLSEFREFALKGNVVDLAVGVIIGAAFGKIVSALLDKYPAFHDTGRQI